MSRRGILFGGKRMPVETARFGDLLEAVRALGWCTT